MLGITKQKPKRKFAFKSFVETVPTFVLTEFSGINCLGFFQVLPDQQQRLLPGVSLLKLLPRHRRSKIS
jgi:hypothetical protein